jgi:hypothetical protein
MVKQALGSKECGACVVAMLTGHTKEEILGEVPGPEKPDYFWLNFMHRLGFVLEDVRNDKNLDKTLAWDGMFNGHLSLPCGSRYYCSIRVPLGTHAIAIDETGMVYDPSTSAPMKGTCTLGEYLRFNREKFGTIAIGCCYRVNGQAK